MCMYKFFSTVDPTWGKSTKTKVSSARNITGLSIRPM